MPAENSRPFSKVALSIETVAKQNYPQYVNEGDWDYYLLLKGNAKKQ
jgi:hypothetical protein